MWPWDRRRAAEAEGVRVEAAESKRQVADAERKELAAEARLQAAKRLVAHSSGVRNALDAELRQNGFTRLFEEAIRRA